MFYPDDPRNEDRRRKRAVGAYIRFIDFMMLVPGSLKGLADAFRLPIQKGDFPHKFANKDPGKRNKA